METIPAYLYPKWIDSLNRIENNQNTFATFVGLIMEKYDVPKADSFRDFERRRYLIEDGILYTYLWGHLDGFINMPLTSIRNLLTTPSYTGDQNRQNEVDLRRYRLLGSLFYPPGSDELDNTNFGLLPPKDARDEYRRNYANRFNAYSSSSLGGFLQKNPHKIPGVLIVSASSNN